MVYKFLKICRCDKLMGFLKLMCVSFRVKMWYNINICRWFISIFLIANAIIHGTSKILLCLLFKYAYGVHSQ